MKEFNPKVAEVLKEYGFDHVVVDSLEFTRLRGELILSRLTQRELKRVILDEKEKPTPGTQVQSAPLELVVVTQSSETIISSCRG